MPAAHVQSKSTSDLGAFTSFALAFPAAVGSGNSVCGMLTYGTAASSDFNAVTDDKGNSYTVDLVKVDSVNGQSAGIFFLSNITNAPQTITASFGGKSVAANGLIIHEASGTSTTSTIKDGSTGQLQTARSTAANNVDSGNVTTVSNGDYIAGFTCRTDATVAGGLFAAGTGYTLRENTGSNLGLGSETLIQAAAASTDATFTSSTPSITTISFILALKAATGGGGAASVVAPRLALLGVR